MKNPLRKMILLLMLFVCPFITYSDDDDNPCPPDGDSPGPCYSWAGKPDCKWVYNDPGEKPDGCYELNENCVWEEYTPDCSAEEQAVQAQQVEIDTINTYIRIYEVQIEDLSAEKQQLQAQREAFEQEKQDLIQQIGTLQNLIENNKLLIDIIEQRIPGLIDSCVFFRQYCDELDQTQIDLEIAYERVALMEAEWLLLNDQLQEVVNVIATIDNEIAALNQDLIDVQAGLDLLRLDLAAAEEEMEVLQQALSDCLECK